MVKSGNEYFMNDRLYIIPQDEETRISLLNVDRNTKEDVRRLHRLYVDHDWHCNTIANTYIETIIRHLGYDVKNNGNANSKFDFYDLFLAYVTVKQNEDAEKEGNINIAFQPEEKVAEIITDPVPREEREYEYIAPSARYVFVDNEPKTKAYEKLDKVARMELQEKYGITIPDPWMVTAISYVFMENIIRELLYKLTLTGKLSSSINFNDNIEMHAIMKNGEVSISLRPGMNAKLLIKSDETTEAEDLDD